MLARLVLVFGLLFFGLGSARAQVTDYTDLWFDPTESGWGVTFTQNEDLIYMTFYVYGPSRQPVWYFAITNRDTNGDFSGLVYVSSGPFFGGSFDPSTVSGRAAGFATFHPFNGFQGTISYTADGFGHSSFIERQSLKNVLVGGTYRVVYSGSQTGCNNLGDNRSFTDTNDVVASQTFAPNTIRLDFFRNGVAACSMAGIYAQAGKLIRLEDAAYTCPSGLNTRVNISDVLVTPVGIEGTWAAATGNGCIETARFAGVLQ